MTIDRRQHEEHVRSCLDAGADVALMDEFRWFLRYQPETQRPGGRHFLFVGMNPSNAVRFAQCADGGDPTTGLVRDFLSQLEQPGYRDAAGIAGPVAGATLINLIPLVQGTSGKVRERWAALPGDDREWALALTLDLAKEFIAGADVTVAMWGSGGGWKTPPARAFRELFAAHPERTVLAARNGGGTPMHIKQYSALPWKGAPLEPFPFKDAR